MTTSIDAPVLLDVDDAGIARLRLNRPDTANGVDVELLKALHDAVLRCHADPRVRVVRLSGAAGMAVPEPGGNSRLLRPCVTRLW